MWLKDMSDWGGLGDWLGSSFGIVLTIGAVLATTAFFIGYHGVGRDVERLVNLGDRIGASGGPPSPEQQADMGRLMSALEKHGKLDLLLLVLAVTAMSTARYW